MSLLEARFVVLSVPRTSAAQDVAVRGSTSALTLETPLGADDVVTLPAG